MEERRSTITKEQGRILARSIYKDISTYIQLHNAEFKEFMLEEEENEHKKEHTKNHGAC